MHKFYKVSNLPLETKKEIINFAKNNCTDWWADKLDVSESWARQKIDMNYEDIMKKFTDNSHFVVIDREAINNAYTDEDRYGEVAFRTMDLIDYFLWIYIDIDKLTELVNKFNLT